MATTEHPILATRRAICDLTPGVSNAGVIEVTYGLWGYAAIFKADDQRALGTVMLTFGGDYRTIDAAFDDVFSCAYMRHEEGEGVESN